MGETVPVAYTAFDGTEVRADALKLKIIKKKVGSANDIARLAAPKGVQMLYNAMRVGPRLILRSAFELLRANMVTRVISVVVLLAIDKFSLIRGRISFKQFVINVTLALMLLVGGTAGWVLGSHALSLILESLVLGILAGIVGAGILSALLSIIVNKIIHLFVTDDTEDMLGIYSKTFAFLASKHRLNNQEIEATKENIAMCKQLIQDLFTQENKEEFANTTLMPHIKEQYDMRGQEEEQ
ncbi:MAG: hypothetical protein FWE11_04155 [Defluviitaleaceae bacterium]|nr:hypothetical protein [Defluviitaleaceae bacterium]